MASALSPEQRVHVIAAANAMAELLHQMNDSAVPALETQRHDPPTAYEHVSLALRLLLPLLHQETARLYEYIVFARTTAEEALEWIEKNPE